MPSIIPGASGTVLLVIGGLLVLVGLLLAFLGRKLWTPFMSLVGAILGGSVGYLIALYYAPNSTVTAIILGLVGSVLGSILFNYLVKIALALIAGAIPALLVYRALAPNPVTDQTAQDTPVIVAILVLLLVFAIAYYFVEELIGVVTSLVGGFLLGAGVFLVTANGNLALSLGGLVFLVGSVLQTLAIRAAKKGSSWRLRRARAAAIAPAPYPYAPPPSPPPAAAPRASNAPPATNPPANLPPPPPP